MTSVTITFRSFPKMRVNQVNIAMSKDLGIARHWLPPNIAVLQ
uniref:Uncharacterized protein n=1 Tax=Rhizobium rhizogenes TaxID=359 RepID=A0A7S5DR92_RHIRH|nr:hypothetical protein pC5.7b_354 [Rhizobium rhizogenes]